MANTTKVEACDSICLGRHIMMRLIGKSHTSLVARLASSARQTLPLRPDLIIQANSTPHRSQIIRGLRHSAPTRNGLSRRRTKHIHFGATPLFAKHTVQHQHFPWQRVGECLGRAHSYAHPVDSRWRRLVDALQGSQPQPIAYRLQTITGSQNGRL